MRTIAIVVMLVLVGIVLFLGMAYTCLYHPDVIMENWTIPPAICGGVFAVAYVAGSLGEAYEFMSPKAGRKWKVTGLVGMITIGAFVGIMGLLLK